MADEKKSIFAHLEELRRRLLFSIISVIALSALSYTYAEKTLGYLAKYAKPLVFISPEEAFLSYLKISLFGGIVLSAPIIIYNLLRFVWVALDMREKRVFIIYFVSSIFLFAAGAALSYFIALPAAMSFLLGFSSDLIRPFISVSRYISFSVFLILAFSIAFETPLFIVLLTRLGLVNSRMLRRKRRYFVVLLFILAAFLTPPDVITQVLLAIPLLVLYEISVWLSRALEKKR
ncbi:MAG: twin-arginine translocase subunit TatC [Candidatus Omnitrophica bacterium]|nr:twin-arginine translocase subunit TatC [Candidatus Omnitrophota bacterium]